MNKKKVSFLVTNDDGYGSLGIKILKEILLDFNQNLWEIAPKEDQSGKGHSITIKKNVEVICVEKRQYIVTGTPVDCVLIALGAIMKKSVKPEVIFSGINLGANLGNDIYYSGTVGAAREGALNNIKSIALSIVKDNEEELIDWSGVRLQGKNIINNLLRMKWKYNYYININFPNVSSEKIKGIAFAFKGKRKPGRIIKKISESKNKTSFFIDTSRTREKNKDNSDSEIIKKNYISITIHSIDEFLQKDFLQFQSDYKEIAGE